MPRRVEAIQADLTVNTASAISLLKFAVTGSPKWERELAKDILDERERLTNELDSVLDDELQALGCSDVPRIVGAGRPRIGDLVDYRTPSGEIVRARVRSNPVRIVDDQEGHSWRILLEGRKEAIELERCTMVARGKEAG